MLDSATDNYLRYSLELVRVRWIPRLSKRTLEQPLTLYRLLELAGVERGYGDGEKREVGSWVAGEKRACRRSSVGQVIRGTFELPVARNAYRTWVVGCYRPTWCTAYLTTRICLGTDPMPKLFGSLHEDRALEGLTREATPETASPFESPAWETWKEKREKKRGKREEKKVGKINGQAHGPLWSIELSFLSVVWSFVPWTKS